MKEKTLRGEIVAVWWLDPQAFSGPLAIEETKEKEGLPMLSVGILLNDQGKTVRLAQEHYKFRGSGAERFRGVFFVPKAYITKMRKWKT